MAAPLHVPAADAPAHAVLGLTIRILIPSDATGGALSLCEEETPPGAGPPLHIHRDSDEFFRVQEGRYRFRVADADIEASPGDALLVPRGTPHAFVNAGPAPGRLLFGFTPGGGERFFPAIAASGLTPPADMPAILALAAQCGLTILGPNPFAAH
jgi:mannose-6-phosphate isomerase-like protein (cupin superfamily)